MSGLGASRNERYAEVIHDYWCEPCCDGPGLIGNQCASSARAVVALVDEEHARLSAESQMAMATAVEAIRRQRERAEAAEARLAAFEWPPQAVTE